MKIPSYQTKTLVVALIAAVQLVYTPAVAAPTAALSGDIISADTRAPVSGVVVRVLDPGSGDLFTAPPTDAAGAFLFESLPPATYKMAVQQGDGVFAAPSPVVLAPGEHRSVQVALYQNDKDDEAAPSPASAQSAQYKYGAWENPLTATLIALGIAVVVGVIVEEWIGSDSDRRVSSPSNP
jgi:hypothetical protein